MKIAFWAALFLQNTHKILEKASFVRTASLPLWPPELTMDSLHPSILMEILNQRAIASLVMLGGMLVAIVNLRRYPGPSRLVIAATGLLLLPTIGSALAYFHLMANLDQLDHGNYGSMRHAINALTLFGRTVGMAILITAVYYKRPAPKRRRRDVDANTDFSKATFPI